MIRCVAVPVRDAAFHRPLPLPAFIPRSACATEFMTSSRGWILATLALTGLALVVLFAVVPHRLSGDGYVRFVKLDALLREGTLADRKSTRLNSSHTIISY